MMSYPFHLSLPRVVANEPASTPGPPGLTNNGPFVGFSEGIFVTLMSSAALPGLSQSRGTFMVAHMALPQGCQLKDCCQ